MTASISLLLALCDQLGIDPAHEAEIYRMNRIDSGLHLYGGWFHFVGAVESENDTVGRLDVERSDAPFSLYFTNNAQVLEDSFKGLSVAQIEFVAQAPWVLGEPESP